MNTIGRILKLTTFGESHGPAIGGVIDGIPAGIKINLSEIEKALLKRRPGRFRFQSQRNENDQVEFLSGMNNDVTTGTPIGFIIRNLDIKSDDYYELKDVYRPSHAGYTYEMKYGIYDYKGGGRASARETVARVVAGSIAMQAMKERGIDIFAFIRKIGDIEAQFCKPDHQLIDQSVLFCPDAEATEKMLALINQCIIEKDSIGGEVHCIIQGLPAGLGEPVYDKLSARLGYAMMSINGVKGFEIGSGFRCVSMKGSEHNDPFVYKNNHISTSKNDEGGVVAGISTGEELSLKIAFKPASGIGKHQKTIKKDGQETEIAIQGRHDACIAVRGVPVVEAMAAITIFDFLLLNRLSKC